MDSKEQSGTRSVTTSDGSSRQCDNSCLHNQHILDRIRISSLGLSEEKPATSCSEFEHFTEDVQSIGHVSDQLTPSVDHVTGQMTSTVGHVTGQLTPSVNHVTGQLTPSVDHVTGQLTPSIEHVTGQLTPSVDHVTNQVTPNVDHVTGQLTPSVDHVTGGDFCLSAERWSPIGADADDNDNGLSFADSGSLSYISDISSGFENREYNELQREHEQVTNSLMALTTHFAQVQLRLKQIVSAPQDEKQSLLEQLETFAFRGVPDVRGIPVLPLSDPVTSVVDTTQHELVEKHRQKQLQLMQQLKSQLQDLEQYAYQTGEAGPPSSVVLEKQCFIIDELKGKLGMEFDRLETLSTEDLRRLVDCAVSQLVSPLKVKEQLITQLKTQVQDLERFIDFLQGVSGSEAVSTSGRHRRFSRPSSASSSEVGARRQSEHADDVTPRRRVKQRVHKEEFTTTQTDPGTVGAGTSSTLRRVAALLHLLTITQLGCGGAVGRRYAPDYQQSASPRANWQQLYSRLDSAVSLVINLAHEAIRARHLATNRGTDSDSDSRLTTLSPSGVGGEKLTLVVRKHLCAALRNIIQHGLVVKTSHNTSVIPFASCLSLTSLVADTRPPTPADSPTSCHAWHVLLAYYRLRHGDTYNAAPQRRLSDSFSLTRVGHRTITNRMTLLSVLGDIISSHTPLKRSNDAHFKAFVCHGLNTRKLTTWLRLILRTPSIVDELYHRWSCVASPGFDDVLGCLSRLEKINFDLMADLAVRQLKNIKDAF